MSEKLEYNEISKKLYGCYYDSVQMTQVRKALVRRLYEKKIQEQEVANGK